MGSATSSNLRGNTGKSHFPNTVISRICNVDTIMVNSDSRGLIKTCVGAGAISKASIRAN